MTREEKNAKAAVYRAANRALLIERSKAYRAAHPDQVRAGLKHWYEGHAETERTKARERYHANRERRQETGAAWRERNPVRAAAHLAVGSANARARRMGATGRLTTADILALWGREPNCMACGTGRGVDHILGMADGGPNTALNLQNLCPSCNTAKSNTNRAGRARAA